MIIWLNGAFGSGKTQTANELFRRIPGSFLYDPETVGYWLRGNEPKELLTEDFQDEPLWRTINRDMLLSLARNFGGTILVPMTLTSEAYYDEIIGSLRRQGVEVRHFVLCADENTIRKRLWKRLEFKNSWAAKRLPGCLKAFEAETFENHIQTGGKSISEVAEEIADGLSITLAPRQGRFRQKFSRAVTQWKAVRR